MTSVKIPVLPRPPKWNTKSILEPNSVSAINAARTMSNGWNGWADRAEVVLRIMHRQSESLDLTDEDYIALIRLVSQHLPRPDISPGETFENGPEHADAEMPRIPLFELHMRWEAFADVLDTTYTEFAKELSRHKVRPGGVQEMMELGGGDLSLSQLSLTAGPSTGTYLNSILGSMLGPGRSFHTASVSRNDQKQPTMLSMDGDAEQEMHATQDGQNDQEFRYSRLGPEVQDIRNLNIQGLNIEDKEMTD